LLQPVLDEPGVLVVGSEVPNLLQPDAASTLVVSQDVDLAVPVDKVPQIKARLAQVEGLVPSRDEPSIFVPVSPHHIEANFLGLDSSIRDASETYVLHDPQLPLMVFGPIGLLRPGPVVRIDGLRLPLPRPGDLIVEKLVTDRTGEKGARDLLVVAGLLTLATPSDFDDVEALVGRLADEAQYTVKSNLTILSLMEPHPQMPDPLQIRRQVRQLLALLPE